MSDLLNVVTYTEYLNLENDGTVDKYNKSQAQMREHLWQYISNTHHKS